MTGGEQTGTTSGGHWVPLMPGGESTSARLARVEQELDQAREMCFAAEGDLTRMRVECDELRIRLTNEHQATLALLDRRKAELASARADLQRLEEHQEIRARALREKNAKLREIEHLLGIDAIVPHQDAAAAVRDLVAELEQLRATHAHCPKGES